MAPYLAEAAQLGRQPAKALAGRPRRLAETRAPCSGALSRSAEASNGEEQPTGAATGGLRRT